MNICDFLAANASAMPDHPAIVDGERELTYAELNDRVLRIAGHLRALGVDRGDRVAVALKDHAEHVAVIFAIARVGATVLSLEWRSSPAQREATAGRFRAKMTIVEGPGLGSSSKEVIALDEEWNARVAAAPPDRSSGDYWSVPLVIALTGGTTGAAKGVLLTNGQMFMRYLSNLHRGLISKGSRYLSALPLCFTAGRAFCIYHVISGNTVIFYSSPLFDAVGFASIARNQTVTATILVPTQLRMLLAAAGDNGPMLPDMERLVCSSAPLTAEEKRSVVRQLTPNLYECYASSEGGNMTVLDPGDMANPESVGRATFGIQLEIVDEEDRPLPVGATGRIRCRGPGVASGVIGSADGEGSEGFRDGWHYPGEFAAFDERGYLYLKGRASDMIIRNGINIYPQEIEDVLVAHPAVAEAAVVGRASEGEGEVPVAFVVAAGDPDPVALRRHCAKRLSHYTVPERFIFVDALPLTAAQKVHKDDLRARLKEEEPGAGER